MAKRCTHHEVLATGPICQVERCRECNCVSIHLGATTVRLEEAALASMWATLGEALERLSAGGLLQPEAAATGLGRSATRGSA